MKNSNALPECFGNLIESPRVVSIRESAAHLEERLPSKEVGHGKEDDDTKVPGKAATEAVPVVS